MEEVKKYAGSDKDLEEKENDNEAKSFNGLNELEKIINECKRNSDSRNAAIELKGVKSDAVDESLSGNDNEETKKEITTIDERSDADMEKIASKTKH